MIDTMPGGEPIILQKAAKLFYCGGCMKEMAKVRADFFRCGVCGTVYQETCV